jgi:hypothetical protein
MFRNSEQFKILQFLERGMQFETDASGSGGDDNFHEDGPAGSPQNGELHSEGEPLPEDFLKTIEGKKPEDIQRMLYNSQKQIGKQGNELGKLRKEKPITSESLKAEQNRLKTERKAIVEKLKELDPEIDANDYQTFSKQKEELDNKYSELSDKLIDVKVAERTNSILDERNNKELLSKSRKAYEESYGMKFSDEEWQGIEQKARKIGEGLLSTEDIESAVIKQIGAEKYRTTVALQGEMKARQDMAAASGKVTISIGGDSKHTDSVLENFHKLSSVQQAQLFESMTVAQMKELYHKRTGGKLK